MKIAAILAMMLIGMAPSASAGDCYTITNPDARSHCLAKQRKQPSQCYAIQDSQRRSECLAKVKS